MVIENKAVEAVVYHYLLQLHIRQNCLCPIIITTLQEDLLVYMNQLPLQRKGNSHIHMVFLLEERYLLLYCKNIQHPLIGNLKECQLLQIGTHCAGDHLHLQSGSGLLKFHLQYGYVRTC